MMVAQRITCDGPSRGSRFLVDHRQIVCYPPGCLRSYGFTGSREERKGPN